MSRNRMMGFEAKARSRLVIFSVSLALLLLAGAIIQTSLFGKLTYVGAVPDIMLCIVTCIAYFNGNRMGGTAQTIRMAEKKNIPITNVYKRED